MLNMSCEDILQELNIDAKELFRRFCDNEMLAYKYLIKFKNDNTYNRLKAAVETKDYEKVMLESHTLKGTCANLGMSKLFELSAKIVSAVRDDEQASIDDLFTQLSCEYDRSYALLEKLEDFRHPND